MAWKIFGGKGKNVAAPREKDGFFDNVKTFIWAVVIAVIIRSFLFQPFNIPSSSMKPTLLIGDFLFVSKYSYGYSRHSLPFSPNIFAGRVMADEPERGDVVVFKLPSDNRTDFIKRVVGLPGDTIQMRQGTVWLNGQPIEREAAGMFIDLRSDGREVSIPRYLETLPSGRQYYTLDQVENGPADNTGVYTVPTGHYFLMGDNRDNSADSRVMRYVGFVPHENLVGPAKILFFSFADDTRWWQVWQWPLAIRYTRLLNTVD